ncbi:MAG: TetR family transcriptional regulator [Ilumatobacter sp.]|nr:TetR family transcriptional regulator [Ilumatobacter sp.]
MTLSETQEQILDAAMSCIARDGIDGASMRNVAREADVSLGLLSYHFDDKRSMIEAAFQLATNRLLDTTNESLAGVDGADDRVRAYVRGAYHDDFLAPDFLALWIAVWAVARTDAEIAAVERSMVDPYAANLSTLIREARPRLSAREAADRATDVIVIQNGLWLQWARNQHRRDLERGLAQCDSIALAP